MFNRICLFDALVQPPLSLDFLGSMFAKYTSEVEIGIQITLFLLC